MQEAQTEKEQEELDDLGSRYIAMVQYLLLCTTTVLN